MAKKCSGPNFMTFGTEPRRICKLTQDELVLQSNFAHIIFDEFVVIFHSRG